MDHKSHPRFDSGSAAPQSRERAVKNLTFDRKLESRSTREYSIAVQTLFVAMSPSAVRAQSRFCSQTLLLLDKGLDSNSQIFGTAVRRSSVEDDTLR